jgi:hypothetical protein
MSLLRWIAPSALALALTLGLSACSDDGSGTSSSDDSGNGDPKPTGAINMEVYATEEQSCPPGNIHVDVGAVNASPAKTVTDGEDGAKVACAVVPSGGLLSASGSIEKGSASFAFAVKVESGKPSAVGEVAFTDPGSGVRYASAMPPCLFQFAPGSGQAIKEGEIFVQFDCPALESAADPNDACSSRYGYVRLENCAKEAAP